MRATAYMGLKQFDKALADYTELIKQQAPVALVCEEGLITTDEVVVTGA